MTRSIKPRPDGSRRVLQSTGTESRVEPQHRDACNINTIMRKLHSQGVIPHFRTGGNFGNFTGYDDYHAMRTRICDAQDDFHRLPAELRKQFDNDPGKLLEFLDDPENRQAAQEMGLIGPDKPQDPKEPTEVQPSYPEMEAPQKATKAPEKPEPKPAQSAKKA